MSLMARDTRDWISRPNSYRLASWAATRYEIDAYGVVDDLDADAIGGILAAQQTIDTRGQIPVHAHRAGSAQHGQARDGRQHLGGNTDGSQFTFYGHCLLPSMTHGRRQRREAAATGGCRRRLIHVWDELFAGTLVEQKGRVSSADSANADPPPPPTAPGDLISRTLVPGFDLDRVHATIHSAIRAHHVSGLHGVAGGAFHQLDLGQRIVRPATVSTSMRMSAFR